MKLSAAVSATVVGILALVAAGCGSQVDSEPPNVVLVVIDTLRADHVSHFGYERLTAPALDDLKAHSTIFTRCFSTAPWTGPSVASLLTGFSTVRHRANAHGAKLGAEAITLPEVLLARGWDTIGISFNPHVSTKTGLNQGFADFDEFQRAATAYPDIAEMVSRGRPWLERAPVGPFFLYLHPMNVHGPYRVPQEHQSILLGQPPSREFHYRGRRMLAMMRKKQIPLRDDVEASYLQSLMDQYDTAIRYTTDKLAEIFDLLKSSGRYDPSLIVVTSDHGEELFEHGGFSHGYSLHREVLHVPLYVKLPYQREARTVATRVSLVDLYPTVLEALGIEIDHTVDGRSLMPLLREGSRRVKVNDTQPLLQQTTWKSRCVGRAITSGRYKLIDLERNYRGLRNQIQLYDLVADPEEMRNLAAEQAETAEQLRRQLEARFAHYEGLALQEPVNVLEEMDQERLKALGYLDGS
jgi:arylsulfatase A-like enzyme